MLLPWLIFTPFIGGILCCQCEYWKNKKFSRWIAIISILFTFIESLLLLPQVISIEKILFLSSWIPNLGINFNLSLDGLSLIMIILVNLLGILSIICSWEEYDSNPGLFYFYLLLVFSGIMGMFLSSDIFLFLFFGEVILISMYFLITLWGCKDISYITRTSSAIKFFIYNQFSSILMLIAILSLVYINFNKTGNLTFNTQDLLINNFNSSKISKFIMLVLLLAFSIKIPIIPFHSWLPTLHSNASISGSVELMGVLIKTSSYGILRFFPPVSHKLDIFAIYLGVISIFYGAWVAFSQEHLKKLIAYNSITHMGFLLIAIFSRSYVAYQGLVIYIISNTLSTAGMIIICGQLYKRINTFSIPSMGGLWSNLDYIPPMFLFFLVSSMGIPGTGNFIGEFFILFGSFFKYPIAVSISAFGIVFTSIYLITIMHKIFFGPAKFSKKLDKPSFTEIFVLIILQILILTLGLFPNIAFTMINSSIKKILSL